MPPIEAPPELRLNKHMEKMLSSIDDKLDLSDILKSASAQPVYRIDNSQETVSYIGQDIIQGYTGTEIGGAEYATFTEKGIGGCSGSCGPVQDSSRIQVEDVLRKYR